MGHPLPVRTSWLRRLFRLTVSSSCVLVLLIGTMAAQMSFTGGYDMPILCALICQSGLIVFGCYTWPGLGRRERVLAVVIMVCAAIQLPDLAFRRVPAAIGRFRLPSDGCMHSTTLASLARRYPQADLAVQAFELAQRDDYARLDQLFGAQSSEPKRLLTPMSAEAGRVRLITSLLGKGHREQIGVSRFTFDSRNCYSEVTVCVSPVSMGNRCDEVIFVISRPSPGQPWKLVSIAAPDFL